jgi:hypothetical protein
MFAAQIPRHKDVSGRESREVKRLRLANRSLVLAAPATEAGDSARLGFGFGVRCGAAAGVATGAGVGLVELVAADS